MGQTVYTVASVLTLLFVLMYIFAILGFCLFGVVERGDLNNWGNLASAFFTLFSLATVLCVGTVARAEPGEGLSRKYEHVGMLGLLWGPFPTFRCLLVGTGSWGSLLRLVVGQQVPFLSLIL